MSTIRLAPAITARRALVFLDENPAAARFAHALRMCGFEVRAAEGEDPYPVLAGFLSGAQPGELLLIRWPSGSGWVPSAFSRLIMDFGRRLGDSSAAALVLVVDFGWVLGLAEPGHTRLNVPGDPPVAAAALTASLAAKTDRPGASASLTGVLADALLSSGGVVTVSDLFAQAAGHFSRIGSTLTPVLFSHGDIGDIPVSVGRPAGERALGDTARRLSERGERDVPSSAAEIAARVYDLHLSPAGQTLLRRAALLPGALTPELASVLGAAEAMAELEAWGLAETPHPAVRELGLARMAADEAARVSSLLRRHHADARAVRPRTRLTPDSWTLDDRLGHRVYAEAIAAFIRHQDTLPPLTIGIKGPWGVGKTSLMRMVQDLLDPGVTGSEPIRLRLNRGSAAAVTNRELLGRLGARASSKEQEAHPVAGDGWRPTVWFNPWMYQNGEQVWAGLAHEIIDQITSRLPRAERERFWLSLNLARVDKEAVRRRMYWMATTRLAPVALGLAATGLLTVASFAMEGLLPGLEGTAAAVASAGSLGSIAAGAMRLTRFFSEAAEGAFSSLIRPPDPLGRALGVGPTLPEDGYRDRTGFLHLVQTDMRRVLDLVATPRRPLVVFVDDLDRCSPGTVAKVIEAINLFLAGEFPNCVFVLAMEPDVVAAHVEMAYRELMDAMPDDGSARLGWRFLEKIVQLPLSVPLLDDEERLPTYIRALLGLPCSAPPALSAPALDAAPGPALTDRLEAAIRSFAPSVDTLDEAANRAQSALGIAASPGRLAEPTRQAADRVFDDLYSDENAFTAIESTLHAVDLRNPREVKRYLNVFRFYSFITYRRQLAGLGRAGDEAVAKLSALTIGWPHLLAVLTKEAHPGATVLDRLEEAAQRVDGDAWHRALQDAGLTHQDELRQLLATRPPIASLARALL